MPYHNRSAGRAGKSTHGSVRHEVLCQLNLPYDCASMILMCAIRADKLKRAVIEGRCGGRDADGF